jgi:hypothetical protein
VSNQVEDTSINLRICLLLISFLLFACAASERSGSESVSISPYSSHETSVFVSPDRTDAVAADYIQVQASPEVSLNILHNSNLNFFNPAYKTEGCTREINRSIASSAKRYLEIKQIPLLRYYYHISPPDSRELPA